MLVVMCSGIVPNSWFHQPTPVFVNDTTSRPIHSLNLPTITATSGVELMEQIDAWLDCLLLEHFKHNHTERHTSWHSKLLAVGRIRHTT
jgi:hypothetical protein